MAAVSARQRIRIKMKNAVLIKHEQNGLRIRLDEKADWDSLLEEVRAKFTSAARFFEDAALPLTFDGRKLSEEEENEVIDIIEEVTDIRIVCVFTRDPERGELYLRVGEAAADYLVQQRAARLPQTPPPPAICAKAQEEVREEESSGADGERYQILTHSLRSGEVYRTPKTVIVLGSVEDGAALTTGRDAIILGSARGAVRAGEEHLEGKSYFVAASDLRPKKLSICGCVLRTKSRLFTKSYPAVASVKEGVVVTVPFDGDVEALLRPKEQD